MLLKRFIEGETNPMPEVETMLADLLLVGSADVQTKVERFFRLYWAGMVHIGVWSAHGPQDLAMQREMLRDAFSRTQPHLRAGRERSTRCARTSACPARSSIGPEGET